MTTFASLFGGGRLADIGALQAGCELIWDVELDSAIAEVGSQLGGKTFVQSVTDMNWEKLEPPDILWASPPCPNFSVAKHNGAETELDKALAQSIVDAIAILKPKAFVLENVEAYKKSASLRLIEEALFSMGYWVHREVVNSANFGVPQTRRRLILRAVKNGFVPTLTGRKRWVGWYEAIADLIPSLPASKLTQRQIDRSLELFNRLNLEHELSALTHKKSIHRPKALLIPSVGGGIGFGFTVRESHEPSSTVLANYPPRAILIDSDCKVVSMISRSTARFQTIPNWYELPENNTLAGRLIGNGVPCLLAQEIIAPLMDVIAHL